jgi:hypothetical protein
MRRPIFPVLTLGLFTSGLAAQYVGEGPGIVVPAQDVPKLGASGLGVADVAQILLTPHSSLPLNTYYLTATVTKTGATDHDIITGTYDVVTEVFTKTTDVDALMTTGNEFAGTVSNDLKVIAFDSGSASQPRYATRAGTTGAFLNPGSITGVPAGYIDCNFGQIGGQLVLFFVSGLDLHAGDFNPTTGQVTNTRKVVTNPIGAGSHSPSPINDAVGETRSLIFAAQVPGRQSNAFFTSSLDDTTPKFQFHDTPTWLANPDANGGTLVYAEYASGTLYKDPVRIGVVALNSHTIPTSGGTVNLTIFAPTKPSGAPTYVGAVWLGVLGSQGLSFPGIGGSKFSLDPALPLIALPPLAILAERGVGAYNFPLTGPLPKIRFSGMPILLDTTVSQVFLGNTAWYEFK